MYNRIAVIGLGGFGHHVVRALARQGFEILAIDRDEGPVDKVKDLVDQALILDTTDEDALAEINWSEIDIAVVAIGDPHLESSILTVTLLKELGVRRIVSRVGSDLHGRVLKRLGADEIINPELDTAQQFANRISMPNVIDMRHFDEHTVIGEIIPPASFIGKNLIELNLRREYNISVVAIRRYESTSANTEKQRLLANPSAREIIKERDILVAIGRREDIERIGRLGAP